MNDMVRLLEDMLSIRTPNSEFLKLSPTLAINIDKLALEKNKSKIEDFCKEMTDDDLSSWRQLQRHLDQNKFYTLYLLALGDKLKIWKRLPSLQVEWNLPNWPYATRNSSELSSTTD